MWENNMCVCADKIGIKGWEAFLSYVLYKWGSSTEACWTEYTRWFRRYYRYTRAIYRAWCDSCHCGESHGFSPCQANLRWIICLSMSIGVHLINSSSSQVGMFNHMKSCADVHTVVCSSTSWNLFNFCILGTKVGWVLIVFVLKFNFPFLCHIFWSMLSGEWLQDEIHERDMNADFLLIVLRWILCWVTGLASWVLIPYVCQSVESVYYYE